MGNIKEKGAIGLIQAMIYWEKAKSCLDDSATILYAMKTGKCKKGAISLYVMSWFNTTKQFSLRE